MSRYFRFLISRREVAPAPASRSSYYYRPSSTAVLRRCSFVGLKVLQLGALGKGSTCVRVVKINSFRLRFPVFTIFARQTATASRMTNLVGIHIAEN